MSYPFHADVGGRSGYGAVAAKKDEPCDAFWEREVMALMLTTAFTGSWTVDHSRSVLETLPDYHMLSYYEKWLKGLEVLSVECGLLQAEEIAMGCALEPPRSVLQVLRREHVDAALAAGASTLRAAPKPARFAIGDRVKTRARAVDHHTRLPGYARGKVGRIEALHGAHVYPDTNAHGLGEQAQWLYTVVFEGRELWGSQRRDRLSVSIDAWEPYLEPER